MCVFFYRGMRCHTHTEGVMEKENIEFDRSGSKNNILLRLSLWIIHTKKIPPRKYVKIKFTLSGLLSITEALDAILMRRGRNLFPPRQVAPRLVHLYNTPFITTPAGVQILPGVHPLRPRCGPMLIKAWGYY